MTKDTLRELREITARMVGDALEQMGPDKRECNSGCGPLAIMTKIRKLIDENHFTDNNAPAEETEDGFESETQCTNLARNTLDALIYNVLGGTADTLGIERY